jgi:luciferase family oxidoreductase group 1
MDKTKHGAASYLQTVSYAKPGLPKIDSLHNPETALCHFLAFQMLFSCFTSVSQGFINGDMLSRVSVRMSYRLSILDKSPLAEGETAAEALARTLQLARLADEWGYHRFWVAEHHNTAQLASPSPELVIAWIIGQTRRIRVGSGGVMLQHYSPYKVAENFNLLASLAPGRIDLGVGKAPGGLPLSTRALQQGVNAQEKGSFADQLAQLDNWLSLRVNEQEAETVLATPVPPQRVDGFLLGASPESARLAAALDWNFVFAAHLNGDKNLLREVLGIWQQNSARNTLVAVQAIVAPTQQQADRQAAQIELWGVELENGQRVTVASESQAQAFARQACSPAKQIVRRESAVIKGTARSVLAALDELHRDYGIDEFVIDTPVAEGQPRFDSLRLLAEAHASANALQEVAG